MSPSHGWAVCSACSLTASWSALSQERTATSRPPVPRKADGSIANPAQFGGLIIGGSQASSFIDAIFEQAVGDTFKGLIAGVQIFNIRAPSSSTPTRTSLPSADNWRRRLPGQKLGTFGFTNDRQIYCVTDTYPDGSSYWSRLAAEGSGSIGSLADVDLGVAPQPGETLVWDNTSDT